jgi:hypothetical protein
MHSIALLCIFIVRLPHVLVLHHDQGELCVLYLKPHAVTRLLSMVSAIVPSEIQLAFTEVTIIYAVVDHRCWSTVLFVKNLKTY